MSSGFSSGLRMPSPCRKAAANLPSATATGSSSVTIFARTGATLLAKDDSALPMLPTALLMALPTLLKALPMAAKNPMYFSFWGQKL